MIDIMENKVLGPAVLRGEAKVVIAQLQERFGVLPPWVAATLTGATEKQIMTCAKRTLTAKDLETIFKKRG